MKTLYFEIDLQSLNKLDEYSICIRGVRQPTTKEAKVFLAKDSKTLDMVVIAVTPIEKDEAVHFYDFTYEDKWLIFGLTTERSN